LESEVVIGLDGRKFSFLTELSLDDFGGHLELFIKVLGIMRFRWIGAGQGSRKKRQGNVLMGK